MMRRTSLWLSLAAGLFLALLTAWQLGALAHPAGVVEGVVVDAGGPVAGAVVRQQTTATDTTSAADGTFRLAGLPEGITVTYDAEALNARFPFVSLTAHEGMWDGLADEVTINLLISGGGGPCANTVTLIGEEVFIGTGGTHEIYLPALLQTLKVSENL